MCAQQTPQETMPNESAEALSEREWMTASKAGRILGIHRNTVIQRAAKGAFRMKTVGDVPFVHVDDVDAAVKAAEAEKAAESVA